MERALSNRVRSTPPSGIRRFFELAEQRDDVLSLGVGEPDFSAPWPARRAAIAALEAGRTAYTANRGTRELRAAIAGHHRRWGHDYDPEEEILVTAGASEAIDLAIRALVDPGDVVAVAQPTYVSYGPTVGFAGGEVLPVPTDPGDGFALTREALSAAGAEAADVLLYCDPNNPTGGRMDDGDRAEVAAFCCEHDLVVVADEIYAALTYGADHGSIATEPGLRERTIVVNGFSKAYAMTGLRLGYALGPSTAIEGLNRVHQYTMLSAPTTAQAAAVAAIEECDDDVAEMRDAYDRRRRVVLARLREMGLDTPEPTGAFYAFPSVAGLADGADGDERTVDERVAEALLDEQGVAAVPGSAFGAGGAGRLRISYATGLDTLEAALGRIEAFVADRVD